MFRGTGKSFGRYRPFGRVAAHRCLLRLLVGLFLLQHVGRVWFGSDFFGDYAALSASALRHGYVWTLLSYAFLHGGCLHLLLNGLLLHGVGRFVEERVGPGHFLGIFLGSALAGAGFWLCLQPALPCSLIGASAGIAGLLAYACLDLPQQRSWLLLLFVPIRLQLRTLLGLLFTLEIGGFLLLELPGLVPIAHSAHLGGLVAGTGYFFCRETLSLRRPRR
ncbi:MAG: rhomboid family intramembrane serine protease [Puniceicoccales bacterium]|jgi:membrane associated rhomboid family serine protease|nr:rhomboid family intramembrane serine protease [Puniceicoccales bacterium]